MIYEHYDDKLAKIEDRLTLIEQTRYDDVVDILIAEYEVEVTYTPKPPTDKKKAAKDKELKKAQAELRKAQKKLEKLTK